LEPGSWAIEIPKTITRTKVAATAEEAEAAVAGSPRAAVVAVSADIAAVVEAEAAVASAGMAAVMANEPPALTTNTQRKMPRKKRPKPPL